MQNTSLSTIKHWVGDYLRRREASYELRDHAEVERMAHDLGMSPWELRTFAAKGPEASRLLDARMVELGLDETDLVKAGPEVTRDLQRSCTLCKDHRRCRDDLESHNRSADWTSYCPNARTLRSLLAGRLRELA
jgi:hypothetical protein